MFIIAYVWNTASVHLFILLEHLCSCL